MKTILALGAAGVLALSAGFAHAGPDAQVQTFLDEVHAKANTRLAASGLDLTGRDVRVEATVDSDGHLYAVRVIRSSGSPDTDAVVAHALNRLHVEHTPNQLIGARVTFFVDDGGKLASLP
jgi:TonB family protein